MKSSKAAAVPQKNSTTHRRMVLLDIENVNGGAVHDSADASRAYDEVARAVKIRADEQVVIGVGPSSLIAAGLAAPSARKVMGRGLDGADSALLGVLRDERIAERFDEIVIASGDGIFSDEVARLAAAGVSVQVVSPEGSLSLRLRMAAGSALILPRQRKTMGEAA